MANEAVDRSAFETTAPVMADADRAVLFRRLAARYVWWRGPDEAVAASDRLIAQVMNVGDFDDVQALARQVGEARLRKVLQGAAAGQFNGKSWSYWHYRLGLASSEQSPPAMPIRAAS